MEIPAVNSEYEKTKRDAYLFYKSIGQVWCPALNDYVAFDDVGFYHLIKKGRRFRAKSEQMRRFAMLPYVENILASRLFISTEAKVIGTSRAQYWKFVDDRDTDVVKIIIRQFKDGNKHFLSVYGRVKNLRQTA
jgi:hypothetical protein